VQAILAGHLDGLVGNLRFERIKREVARLRHRCQAGWRALCETFGDLPGDLPGVVAELERLLPEPPSAREHGLDPAERSRRAEAEQQRRDELAALLVRARVRLREVWRNPPRAAWREGVERWLCDLEDYLEFGLLPPNREGGILAALGRRHGWRRLHLLRSDDPPPRREPAARRGGRS
jgi:hypothetical protein